MSSDEKLINLLVAVISDGFNRSLGALEDARAIDTKKMRAEYCGVGSRYYDLVTAQIELTAKYATPELKRLLNEKGNLD